MTIREELLNQIIKSHTELKENNLTIIKKDELEDFTGNDYLTTEDLLKASAKGTSENYHLDPIPQLNKLGEAYSTLVKNIGATVSARTDALKMDRENMDYTNDSEYSGVKVYDLDLVAACDINGDGVIGIDDAFIILKNAAIIGSGGRDSLFNEIFATISKSAADNLTWTDTNLGDLTDYGHVAGVYPEDRIYAISEDEQCCYYLFETSEIIQEDTVQHKNYYLFLYNSSYLEGDTTTSWENKFLEKINTLESAGIEPDANLSAAMLVAIDKFGNGKSYITFEQFAEYLGAYEINYYLNLLMPQYKRRVEVEDLNENFWVVGQVLDAMIGTLYGKNCLLDTIISLVTSNGLVQKTLNSIINYLKELDQQIDILQKVSGVGDVRSINWSYKDVINPKISFYENINMTNFKVILQNDYGTRQFKFPISNPSMRNGISYEGFTGEANEKKFLDIFFAEGDNDLATRENRNHLTILKCFDQISLLKKSSLPVECFLWRRIIKDTKNALPHNRCMASFVNVSTNEEIKSEDISTKKKWGYQPYARAYYEPDHEFSYEDILTMNDDLGYYYGFPEEFDIVMYDINYYQYVATNSTRGGSLMLKNTNSSSSCLAGVNTYYKNNDQLPVIFMPSSELYDGEIVIINFKDFCIQDLVPQNDSSLQSAYWTGNNRSFYRTTRAKATDNFNKYNGINLVYLNKDIAYSGFDTAKIKKETYVDVGVISTSDFSIDSPSQYTELSNLEYNHYYNVARCAQKITCYGYAGFSDSEGVFANTSSGLLGANSAHGLYDSGYYQPRDGYDTKESYINTYNEMFNEGKVVNSNGKYDSFDMFKKAILDWKGKGSNIIVPDNKEEKNPKKEYYPFAPVAFKIRNFPFTRKAYLNSAKVTKEISQKDWEVAAPTDIGIYTIDPLNSSSCAYNTGVRADNPRSGEIAYNFINSNAEGTAASIPFDDSLFIFNINWVSNLSGETFIDSSKVNIYPRIVGFNLFGRSCSGAPGDTVAHTIN